MPRYSLLNSRLRPGLLAACCLIMAGGLLAQEGTYSNRTRALASADSRAEREADRIVSLPAEKIIALLQQEPGLFLQVKKMLVREAYQQGRVLDPQIGRAHV